jgi:hypothetical protein
MDSLLARDVNRRILPLEFRNRYEVLDDIWIHRVGLPRPPSRGRSAVWRPQAGETLRPAGWAVCWGRLIQPAAQPPSFRKGRDGRKFVRPLLEVRFPEPLTTLPLTANQLGIAITQARHKLGLHHPAHPIKKIRYLSSACRPMSG